MHRKPYPKSVIVSFFVVGILSAIGFRSLILFTYFNESLFRPVWYASVLGYICFFGFRFHISRRRRSALHYNDLYTKVVNEDELDADDKENLKYIVNSIEKSKETYNYMAIFALSIVAIVADLILSQ